jgi:hypothetical protein
LGVVFGALALAALPETTVAQEIPPSVPLGGVSVESCAAASDPEYGLVQNKAIQIGGGPLYMNAREHRLLDALRGPDGQKLHVVGGVGSLPLDINGSNPTIIDVYTVAYEGHDVPIKIFLDAYHFGHPKAPRGFTCGVPLPTALGVPPVDPFKATPAALALAVDQASQAFPPVPLDPDGSATHGVLFDQFRMMVLAARAARDAGRPFDPDKPPADARSGLVALAYPASCDGRTVPARQVEIVAGQGPPLQPQGPLVADFSELTKLLPGVRVPASSVAARYGLAYLRQTDRIRITYARECAGASTEVLLSPKFEPARLVASAPAPMPPGIVESEPTVYLQAVIDMDGRFRRTIPIGGPSSLTAAALQSLEQWRAQPARVNGAPVVSPTVLQIPIR